jgi:hypothetical protein
MASGNVLYRVSCGGTPRSPLSSTSVVPPTTLKHDPTCIRSKRLMSRVRPLPPHCCPGSSLSLLAKIWMQCTTLTRRAFHPSLFLGYSPCPSLLLRVLRHSARITLRPVLPLTHLCACYSTSPVRSCTRTRFTSQSSVQLVFPSLRKLPCCITVLSLLVCLGFDCWSRDVTTNSWIPRF